MKANQHLKSDRVLYQEGEPVNAEALKWWMEAVQRKAKMEVNGKLHVLRHTFCGHLAMKGVNAVTIKELAGHRSLETTNRYMHLSPNHRATAIALLDDRIGSAPHQAAGRGGLVEAQHTVGQRKDEGAPA